MQIIKKIIALDTFPVRHPVLRNEKPIESCHFDGDNLKSTTHFGLFDSGKIQAVISLFEAKNEWFESEKQIQIRGMAVLEKHQKKGFGEILIINAENYCIQKKSNLIWFNARQEAIGFYQKMGYGIIGVPFEIIDVGEHVVMFKNLSSTNIKIER
ncbi:Acetyltransferase (GNAT) domain-containing protein [Flavobacterium micromati]|jgi:GNAT superfamily N-acetyltransferase|uniref:Acetyltransferase (GNAT) domain-containing protein n=1 Tax=Flavobacterium micromati TaxID=229205 RepID=A0A1M5MCV5_9FLAO|nr:GNAT family N-acetyltransferase [Flavobacterium micromati]SHG75075.1 Acetyltransferase (GNAT) domain-containing protein [Flavobacterium micromati]